MAVIRFEDVKVAYGEDVILQGFNLEVARGEVVTLFGPSGCGKTTLMKTVLGMVRPVQGQVTIDGIAADSYPHVISYTPQDNQLLPWKTVRQNMALWQQESGLSEPTVIDQLLALTELLPHADKLPANLSGGSARRAALARGMALPSSFMCLDEALVSVERRIRRQLMVTLRAHLIQHQMTALIISHDYEEAIFMSDRVIVLSPSPAEVKKTVQVSAFFPHDHRTDADFDAPFFEQAALQLIH